MLGSLYVICKVKAVASRSAVSKEQQISGNNFFCRHLLAYEIDISFPTKDQTHPPCSGSTDNHWTTRESPGQNCFNAD